MKSKIIKQVSKSHRYILVCCVSGFLLLSCKEMIREVDPEPGLLIVSLIDLLAHPDKYEGKKIQVKGYLSNGYIYLSKDHAEVSHDVTLSIYIVEPTEDGSMTQNCSDAYGSVEGVFIVKGRPWRQGMNVIDLVQRVNLFKPEPETCWIGKPPGY